MKKADLINGPISRVVSLLGHTDRLCVADAGLPIPNPVERIDLAVRKGLPSFLDVLNTVTTEMCVEKAILAQELKLQQPAYHTEIVQALESLSKAQGNEIELVYLSHADFKVETGHCKAIIRTGECTPFANVILCAGVTFA